MISFIILISSLLVSPSLAAYGQLQTETQTIILDENFTIHYTGFRCDSTNRDQIEFLGVVEDIDISNWKKGDGFYFGIAFGKEKLFQSDAAICEYHYLGKGVEVPQISIETTCHDSWVESPNDIELDEVTDIIFEYHRFTEHDNSTATLDMDFRKLYNSQDYFKDYLIQPDQTEMQIYWWYGRMKGE